MWWQLTKFLELCVNIINRGLPGWRSGRESVYWYRRHRVDSWVGKISRRRKWQPTTLFLPGKSHGESSLVGYSSRGRQELVTTYQLNNNKYKIACKKDWKEKSLFWGRYNGGFCEGEGECHRSIDRKLNIPSESASLHPGKFLLDLLIFLTRLSLNTFCFSSSFWDQILIHCLNFDKHI